eukprot:351149-Chlamydomonas_euryale.AAC.2
MTAFHTVGQPGASTHFERRHSRLPGMLPETGAGRSGQHSGGGTRPGRPTSSGAADAAARAAPWRWRAVALRAFCGVDERSYHAQRRCRCGGDASAQFFTVRGPTASLESESELQRADP